MTDAVPDADGYEQDLPVATDDADLSAGVDTPTIETDVPEADAFEQALPVPILDEDEAPP